MKKISLGIQLSAGFACIAFAVLFVVSICANMLIRSRFENYIKTEQARFIDDLVQNLANQYDVAEQKFNVDYIHGVGMYAVNDGYFLKVYDSGHELIWDIEKHDMQCCDEMMRKINETMDKFKSSDGSFVTHEYPMQTDGKLVGYAQIMYYTPFYMNENAFRFIDSLDTIIAVTGVGSLLFAAFAGILFARSITRPVLSVIAQTKQIAGGDYTLKPENNANSLEIYELTQAVEIMADKLDEQEKLRVRLTDDVAHELRTPLTNISSRLEMMSDGIWEPTRERITSCYEEIDRISRLVDDMEKLHSINAENANLEKTEFSVKDMLENAAAAFEGEFSTKSISADIECEDIYIKADRDKLVRAVTNLISNSVKYSPNGGKIKLTASKQNNALELTVSDTGSGIPKEDLPYIFERFYRADKSRNRSTGGSGIGLAVTKAIVDAHGGKIKAESTVGNGTKIIISLPLR